MQIHDIILPKLSLYIHIPWCVLKCPYCDFNSHQVTKQGIPEKEYISCLLKDLTADLYYVQNRKISSIFIGGGTPSLFSAEGIFSLLANIKKLVEFADDIEITIEANPSSVESDKFISYQQAGINRISIGVQSFNDDKLKRIGRIHNSKEAMQAILHAKSLNLPSFNIDLMHGLPNQSIREAMDDLKQAVELNPPHLSWYQLTIEPNTLFGSRPPKLPNDDELWSIFDLGHKLLTNAGYSQYEISAYSKQNLQCKHNLNYWRYGDYLAIGCGAHGKISFADGNIERFSKVKHPKGYLTGLFVENKQKIPARDRPFEFFMNRFRLLEPVPKREFVIYTGIELNDIKSSIDLAIAENYIIDTTNFWQITHKGKLFLNDLLNLFLYD